MVDSDQEQDKRHESEAGEDLLPLWSGRKESI